MLQRKVSSVGHSGLIPTQMGNKLFQKEELNKSAKDKSFKEQIIRPQKMLPIDNLKIGFFGKKYIFGLI